jgi:FAD/FMN-containing dehydrogenase
MSNTPALSLHDLIQHANGPDWARAVDNALSRIERLLRRDPADAVDGTRQTLVRRADQLGQDHAALLAQTAALRQELRCADAATLRERLEEFAAALHRLEEKEAGLVLESVTTDLGAGD